jgi:hexokinase
MYINDLKEKIDKFGASKVEALDARKFSEVQIAGRYLYSLMLNGLLLLGEANVDIIGTICAQETECLSRILKKDFSGMQTHAKTELSLMEMKNMFELANMLVRRSEDLVAAELAGAAMFSGIETGPLKVATDGSVINLVPDFKTNVQKKLSEILGNTQVELVTIEDSGLKGGANAVLSASRSDNQQ